MGRVFIDTNVPMYAAGANHPLVEPARRVIEAAASARIDAVTDVEVFQEILYRYAHIRQQEKGFAIFDHFLRVMMGRVLPVSDHDARAARELAERYPGLGPRDLIHLAVMARHGIEEIVTADAGFDAVGEVRRIDLRAFE